MVRRGQILPQQILRNFDGINNHAIGAHGEKTRTQCCHSRSRIIAQSSLESTLKFAVTVSRCARSAPEIHKVSRSSVRQCMPVASDEKGPLSIARRRKR